MEVIIRAFTGPTLAPDELTTVYISALVDKCLTQMTIPTLRSVLVKNLNIPTEYGMAAVIAIRRRIVRNNQAVVDSDNASIPSAVSIQAAVKVPTISSCFFGISFAVWRRERDVIILVNRENAQRELWLELPPNDSARDSDNRRLRRLSPADLKPDQKDRAE